jgi:hypothetical protein
MIVIEFFASEEVNTSKFEDSRFRHDCVTSLFRYVFLFLFILLYIIDVYHYNLVRPLL